MMSPYPTSMDRDMRLLAQIGISTDTRPPGTGGIDKTRLRGYLEIDDTKLTAALQDHADAVKQLFGNDTDGDLVVDSGVAFKLDNLLRPYVQTGGILALRVDGLDSRIAQTNKQITDLKTELDAKQADLKEKYAQMAGALDELSKNSQDITNFNRQQSSGQSGQ